MNKIIKKALETCSPSIEALLTVINATDNPEVATEILLGVYEFPVVNLNSTKLGPLYHNPVMESYNPITNKVCFQYEECDTKDGWFLRTNPETTPELAVVDAWNVDSAHEKFMATNPQYYMSIADFRDLYERRTYSKGLTGRKCTSYVRLNDWQ